MNLARIIEPHPDDAPALVGQDATVSYDELRERVAGLRGGMSGLGVRPGDRVALLLSNRADFVVAYLAALGLGAVVAPLNPGGAPKELQRELTASGARVAVVGAGARAAFAEAERGAVPVEHVVVPEGVELEGALALSTLVGAAPVPIVDREPHDLAVLIFTAGTSGPSRGAMLTHGNLLANLEQVQAHPGRGLTPQDVGLGVLPMFHIFGLNVVLGLSLFAGASVVLAERFDPEATLRTVREHGATIVAGAPPMYVAWSTMPGEYGPDDVASVRLAVSGASKLLEDVAQAFERRFGIELSEGYGLTEASPIVTSSAGDEPRYGSIGVPLPGVEVRLVDEEGEDALVGDPGEIWVRGPNVFAGYLDDAEATSRALTSDGWLRTGDVAVADDDGYLYIVDRAKDLVIVSGFNVYPAEVEEVLVEHPGIAEAAVIGEDDAYSGETVKAYVVAADGASLDEREVIEFCARSLARYKCPTSVTVLDEIPRGLAGKALRRALR